MPRFRCDAQGYVGRLVSTKLVILPRTDTSFIDAEHFDADIDSSAGPDLHLWLTGFL